MKSQLILIVLLITLENCYSKPIEMVVFGQAGVGKSSLINFLMNKEVAYVGHDDTGTTNVNYYETHQYGFDFKIFDTPGLFDSTNSDQEIMRTIIKDAKRFNILLVCYDLSAKRLSDNDVQLKNLIVENFGKETLDYTLIIYTKANEINNQSAINNIITKRHHKMGWNNIPYGIAYDDLNENDWKTTVWYKMFDVAKKNNLGFYDVVAASTELLVKKTKALLLKEKEEKERKEKMIQEAIEKNKKQIETYKKQEYSTHEANGYNQYYNSQQHKDGCIDINGLSYIIKNNVVKVIKIKDIKVGDFVKTSQGFSEVYFTYEHEKQYKMVFLQTMNDFVKITENHIILVKRNKELMYLNAKNITIGDSIQTIFQDKLYWTSVINISVGYEKAKYVLTTNDDIIVNDIVISCHVNDYNYGYYLTYPLRWIYNYCPNCMKQDYNPIVEALRSIYQTFFI